MILGVPGFSKTTISEEIGSFLSGHKFVKIAKDRVIGSFFSSLKFVKIAKKSRTKLSFFVANF